MGYPPENPQDSGISLTHPLPPTTLPPPRCQTPRRQAVRTAMFHGTRPGWIEVIAGVMFSGKSEELVRRVRRAVIARKHVQVFKSHLDARYAGLYTVSTHDGGTVEAEPVDSSDGVLRAVRPDTEVVAVAEIVDKLQAICVVCGGPASRNQRLVNGRPALWESPTIMVGGRESYEARCRHCHKVPRADEDQTALL